MASMIILAAACVVFVAQLSVEREPNWVALSSGKTVDVSVTKADAHAAAEPVDHQKTGVHDTTTSSPFSGIASFVKGVSEMFNNHTTVMPMKNAPKVKVELYMESLCPGCQYFTSHVLFPVMKEKGMSDIIDLSIIPAGNAELAIDKKTKKSKIVCQHGETECEGNKIVACMQKHQDQVSEMLHGTDPAYLDTLDCIENHSPTELGSPFSGMANTTQGLFIIRSNAGLCIKKHGLPMDDIMACSEGAEGEQLLDQAVVQTAQLKPAFQYAPWVVVNGEALEDDAYSLKERVCNAYLGVKPEECEPSRLKDYFPAQILNAASEAIDSMSTKAARTQLDSYFDTLSEQQAKQHRLALQRAKKGGRKAVAASAKQSTVQALSSAPTHEMPFQYCDKSGHKVMV